MPEHLISVVYECCGDIAWTTLAEDICQYVNTIRVVYKVFSPLISLLVC